MNQKIILFLLGTINFIHTGFSADTLIKTDKSYVPIQFISNRNNIVSFDIETNLIDTNELIHTFTVCSSIYYHIHLGDNSIICSKNQTFYDPQLKKWIKAKDVSQESYFLDYYGNSIPCIRIDHIQSTQPRIFYEITLNKPHTYFVSKAQILTHNVVPIVIGLSWVLGEGVALTGAGVGLGALGLGVWQKFGKNKKITFAQIEQECMSSASGGAPDPDENNKAENMYEVFKNHPVGKELKKYSTKTKFYVKGQTVWKANNDIAQLGIKKGDLYYLDSLHKDHIEVFSSKGRMPLRTVLNLDGTVNTGKIDQAIMRNLSRFIG